MNLEKAQAEGDALKSLGWRLHNLEFERRTGPLVELVALRGGRPVAFARTDLPEAEARAALREHGYRRRFKRLVKATWGAESLPRVPRAARAFARRFAAWDSRVLQFLHVHDLSVGELGWTLSCSLCWFPGEGASWDVDLCSSEMPRRSDLQSLKKAARTFGFRGSTKLVRSRGTVWFRIHAGPARSPVLPFARRYLRFLEAAIRP